MNELVYSFGQDGGLVLTYGEEERLRVPHDGEFGIFYEVDDVLGGTVIKHGNAQAVRAAFDTHVRALGPEHNDGLKFVTMPVAALDRSVIEEVNACLAVSGRIGRFAERLESLAATAAPGGPRH